MVIDALAWEVMNCTADDWESLEVIQQMVNRQGNDVTERELVDTVKRLLISGLLEQHPKEAAVSESWFRMTHVGRIAWQDYAKQYMRDL